MNEDDFMDVPSDRDLLYDGSKDTYACHARALRAFHRGNYKSALRYIIHHLRVHNHDEMRHNDGSVNHEKYREYLGKVMLTGDCLSKTGEPYKAAAKYLNVLDYARILRFVDVEQSALLKLGDLEFEQFSAMVYLQADDPSDDEKALTAAKKWFKLANMFYPDRYPRSKKQKPFQVTLRSASSYYKEAYQIAAERAGDAWHAYSGATLAETTQKLNESKARLKEASVAAFKLGRVLFHSAIQFSKESGAEGQTPSSLLKQAVKLLEESEANFTRLGDLGMSDSQVARRRVENLCVLAEAHSTSAMRWENAYSAWLDEHIDWGAGQRKRDKEVLEHLVAAEKFYLKGIELLNSLRAVSVLDEEFNGIWLDDWTEGSALFGRAKVLVSIAQSLEASAQAGARVTVEWCRQTAQAARKAIESFTNASKEHAPRFPTLNLVSGLEEKLTILDAKVERRSRELPELSSNNGATDQATEGATQEVKFQAWNNATQDAMDEALTKATQEVMNQARVDSYPNPIPNPEEEEIKAWADSARPLESLHNFVGLKVVKLFPGMGTFTGKVASFLPRGEWYHVVYEDGDKEDMTLEELLPHIVPLSQIPIRY